MALESSNVQKDFKGYWNYQHSPFQFGTPVADGAPQTAALMLGGGTETYPLATAAAAACFVKLYCKTTDTGEDNRLAYLHYKAAGAAGGFEGLRVKTVGAAAAIGAIRGGSFNAGVDTTATSQVGGLGCGVEAQFEAGAATRVMTGTIACLNLSAYIGAGNTLPASHAYIRCVNDGSVLFSNLLDLSSFTATANSATVLCATSADSTSTYRIKIRGPAGVTMWLMATTTAPNGA